MKGKRVTLKKIYFIYLSLLLLASISMITYVNVLLRQYEELRPERCVEEAIDKLQEDVLEGNFWDKYFMPKVEAGNFEKHLDIQSKYLSLYMDEKIEFTQKNGIYAEDELYYTVENKGSILAEIKLKARGPSVTKLGVLNFREWQIEEIKPSIETDDYTLSVPSDFVVRANGVSLTTADGTVSGENEITYTIPDVYFEPVFDITNREGKTVAYRVDQKQVIAEFYNYTLTLPTALTVEVNQEAVQGEELEGNRVRYTIRLLEKPQVRIRDYYGNEVNYEGTDEFPLTYMTIRADSRYTVTVSGKPVPKEAISASGNGEYELLADYVEDLPQVNEFEIAILENDAQVLVADEKGEPIVLEPGKTIHDLTQQLNGFEAVPKEVGAEIDVLHAAQQWSLFMSNDLPFAEIEKYLIADSYQYEVAKKYATGIDITFTTEHTLMDPAFTNSSVSNFVWITDNSFSVDIGFIKHMLLWSGRQMDDQMNDRFYFVKYDETDDNIHNPVWKIAGMKENVQNE